MTAEPLALEFARDDAEAGFRLQRLELLNWGTFDRMVWHLDLNGSNTLLTGDIGSGKSTLVDAVTTLLVPAHRVAYNKAAGADGKERSLRSYVLGHYKSERNEIGGSSKPVALRDGSTFSAILGVFSNLAYNQTITLAQVFWMKEPLGQPARLFIAAERELSIAERLSGFGAEMAGLRKQIRGLGADLFDTFPPYGAWLRRRLGIESEQALELFHQTVSMKSVGNLTDFVRLHMLDAGNPQERIDALLDHFDDLNRAHGAVLRAKRQTEILGPLVDDCDRHDEMITERSLHERCRNALETYFADLRCQLLRERIADLDGQRAKVQARGARQADERQTLLTRREALRRDMAASGGDRLAAIEAEIAHFEADRDRRKQRAGEYAQLCGDLEVPVAQNVDEFLSTRRELNERREQLRDQETQIQNTLNEHGVTMARAREEHSERDAELASLRARRTSIPHEQVALRERLCTALAIDASDVPFAGEMLQVRDDEQEWQGSAERLLRSFGLSLLVRDEHYAAVQAWVDATDTRRRVVYFRVRDSASRGAPGEVHRESLVHKIELRSDGRWRQWLQSELARRFDYACCVTDEQFRRERRALTRNGQVKGGDERHEKDDRFTIDDRSRYVLGWSNADKIIALEREQRTLEDSIASLGKRLADLQAAQRDKRAVQVAVEKLSVYDDYRDLDWHTSARLIAERCDERARLTATSDRLRHLQEESVRNDDALRKLETSIDQTRDELAKIEVQRDNCDELMVELRVVLDGPDAATHLALRADIGDLRTKLEMQPSTLRSCEADERALRENLQREIDAVSHRIARLVERIVKTMQLYRGEFPAESAEVDASVSAASDYRALLHQLATDDLPRHEARFKQLLNENTIREIANFHSQLARQQEEIGERIEAINASLTNIDYNPGRYVALELALADDAEVRQFRQDLRACTEGTLSGSDDPHYAETKFLQVRALIDRFRGREGLSELDRRWTSKVTDVRNWFVFAASERWREDASEYEHYSDSSGKSGGQKEKLAYTVLAASLAYQFGLEWGEIRSRSFRFVVIDEAFGKGSDESARYGLELFARLNLQLLVVTPLTKIHVIEPYVRTVGFVHNEGGSSSKLRNLTIQEYRDEKHRRRGGDGP